MKTRPDLDKGAELTVETENSLSVLVEERLSGSLNRASLGEILPFLEQER